MAHWFDEQLRERMRMDRDQFDRAFGDLASVIMGDRFGERFQNDRQRVKNAVDEVLRYLHITLTAVPEQVEDVNEYLDYALRPTGVMKRRVTLSGAWYANTIGPMLGSLTSGEVVALLPRRFRGYEYLDPQSGRRVPVTRERAAQIEPEAYCFYKPFPQTKMTVVDLARYMVSALSMDDAALYGLVSLLVTLFGLLTPMVNQLLFGTVIPSGRTDYLLPTLMMLLSFAIGSAMLNVSRNFLSRRITTRIQLAVEPAAMARVLLLPATFFKRYNSGELASRLNALTTLCDRLVNTVTGTLLSALLSLIYLFQINTLAGELVEFPGGIRGIVLNLEEQSVGVAIMGEAAGIREGDAVRRTERIASVPVGPALAGRIVDALGAPIDGGPALAGAELRPIETPAPGILDRQKVREPLQTGIKVIDALTPIGDFNERFGADFDEDEYDTIGGLVTAAIGHLPEAGEELAMGRFVFRVANADARRVHAFHVGVHGQPS